MGASVRRRPWVVWTSALSPFGLKVVLLCRYAGLDFRILPATGSLAERLHYTARLALLKSGWLPLTWPRMSADDEFPLVPFLFGPGGENLYDSTAIAVWFDQRASAQRRLLPADPLANFIAGLIDDYADEMGLYMVHHNRWKVSALDNNASERLINELGLPWPLRSLAMARWRQRQTARLPYLFSVAPAGFRIAGVPPAMQPPARSGFPPTHELLESAFGRLLDILEALLARRPFIFGDRLTLADASIYGQLGMNLDDASANQLIRARAPALHQWLQRLHRGDPELLHASGDLRPDADLMPLLAEITRVFVPLMQQNHAACTTWRAMGESAFNEVAFNQSRALYDGTLDGFPFRHCAKTFQARVWRERVKQWQTLPGPQRDTLEALLPTGHGLGSLEGNAGTQKCQLVPANI